MCVRARACMRACVLGKRRSSEKAGWGVKRNRAVPLGNLDWSQVIKGLKCEAKLFDFLFGR